MISSHPLRFSLLEEALVVELSGIDGIDLALVEPFDALAVLPQPILDLIVLGNEIGAQAMLLALVPEALVASSIRPSVNSEAVLLIVLVLALIHPAIVPDVDAHALHVVVEPLALVFAAIKPRVNAYSTDLVLTPVTCVL